MKTNKDYVGDQLHRQFITHYTPDTSLKPILVFSLLTDIDNDTSELAVVFVSALNFHHALEKMYVQKTCYERAGWGDPRENISEFIILNNFDSITQGLKEMQELTLNMNWDKYLDFFIKYYDNSIPGQDVVIEGVIRSWREK